MLSPLVPLFLFAISANAVKELCGRYDTYKEMPYFWNNNVWNGDGTGSACTYVSDDPASANNSFEVLWQWDGPPDVRGFPHVDFLSVLLPLELSDLRSLVVEAAWEMAPSSLEAGASHDPNTEPNASALEENDVEANVCIDIFADPDEKTSQVPGKQKYEIMIWFGQFGSGSLPVGNTDLLDPPIVTLIQDTEFMLYTGTNPKGQIVHSWVANKTLTTFAMDFAPLLGILSAQDMVPDDVYLGVVQFGTETFSASSQVNFTVTNYEARVQGADGEADGNATVSGRLVGVDPDNTMDGPPVATQVPTSLGVSKSTVTSAGSVALSLLVVVISCMNAI